MRSLGPNNVFFFGGSARWLILTVSIGADGIHYIFTSCHSEIEICRRHRQNPTAQPSSSPSAVGKSSFISKSLYPCCSYVIMISVATCHVPKPALPTNRDIKCAKTPSWLKAFCRFQHVVYTMFLKTPPDQSLDTCLQPLTHRY